MFWDEMGRRLEKVLEGSGARQKEIIIWGYYCEIGEFLYDYLKKRGGYQVSIIDKNDTNEGIQRAEFLKTKDPAGVFIFLCMKDTEEPEMLCKEIGALKDQHYFDVREVLFDDNKGQSLNFLIWMEDKYGCDFLENKRNESFECAEYTPSPYMTIKEIVSSVSLKSDDAIFDYGMGKGAALVQFYEYGFRNLGGVERDQELCTIAQDNFDRLKISDIEICCADAREITEIDRYNYFYFYNPFSGSVFQKVIDNIKDSYMRNHRKIRIIYINTVCHDMILDSGIFQIEKQIETKHWYPMVNIYMT